MTELPPPEIQNWTDPEWIDTMIELVRPDFGCYTVKRSEKFLHWDDTTRLWLPTTQKYLYGQVSTRLNQHLLNLGLQQSFITRHVRPARLVSYGYREISLDDHNQPHDYDPKTPKLNLRIISLLPCLTI